MNCGLCGDELTDAPGQSFTTTIRGGVLILCATPIGPYLAIPRRPLDVLPAMRSRPRRAATLPPSSVTLPR